MVIGVIYILFFPPAIVCRSYIYSPIPLNINWKADVDFGKMFRQWGKILRTPVAVVLIIWALLMGLSAHVVWAMFDSFSR